MVRLVVGHILQEQEDTKAMEMPVVQVCIPAVIRVSASIVTYFATHAHTPCTAI